MRYKIKMVSEDVYSFKEYLVVHLKQSPQFLLCLDSDEKAFASPQASLSGTDSPNFRRKLFGATSSSMFEAENPTRRRISVARCELT